MINTEMAIICTATKYIMLQQKVIISVGGVTDFFISVGVVSRRSL